MKRALIGYTGFVGSNLRGQGTFTHLYNSANFRDMTGQTYDEVVCAGVSAVKWWANQNADADWRGISTLREVLASLNVNHFTLISTVDVYKFPNGVNESTGVTDGNHPYGRHRRLLEMFVEQQFSNRLVVRLPGLFGRHLKKNLIYDVLVGKDLSGFDCKSRFQFYHLDDLSADLAIAARAGLSLVNFAVEPVSTAEVMKAMTGADWQVTTTAPKADYDMRTLHAGLWNRNGDYIRSKASMLERIADFAKAWRMEAGGVAS